MRRKGILLSEAIADLRRQLHEGILAAEGDDLKLRVESLEVELMVEASKEGDVTASGRVWSIVSLGGRFGFRRSQTHRVLLKLAPELMEEHSDGTVQRKPIDLRNKRPLIAEQ
jgi:hypothetical protein